MSLGKDEFFSQLIKIGKYVSVKPKKVFGHTITNPGTEPFYNYIRSIYKVISDFGEFVEDPKIKDYYNKVSSSALKNLDNERKVYKQCKKKIDGAKDDYCSKLIEHCTSLVKFIRDLNCDKMNYLILSLNTVQDDIGKISPRNGVKTEAAETSDCTNNGQGDKRRFSGSSVIEITANNTSEAYEKLNAIPEYTKQNVIKIGTIVLPIKTAYIYDFIVKALEIVQRIKLIKISNEDISGTIVSSEKAISKALTPFQTDYTLDEFKKKRIGYIGCKVNDDSSGNFKYNYVLYLSDFLEKLSTVSIALGLPSQFNNSVKNCLEDCASFAIFKDRDESITSLFSDYLSYCESLMSIVDGMYDLSMVKKILKEEELDKINSLSEFIKDLGYMKEKSESYQYNEVKEILNDKYISSQGYCLLHTLPAYVFTKYGCTQLVLIKDILSFLNKIVEDKATFKDVNECEHMLKGYSSHRILVLDPSLNNNLKNVQNQIALVKKNQNMNEFNKNSVRSAVNSFNEENKNLKDVIDKIDKLENSKVGLKFLVENVTNRMLSLKF